MRVDRGRILQVLDNLLTNAIRHAGDGGRVLAAAEAPGAEVRFRVSATGSGIPEELRAHVFDRFWQGGQRSGAAGLGLPIAKGIVAAHGGEIWVESVTGRGTTFSFTLPVAVPAGEQAVAGSG